MYIKINGKKVLVRPEQMILEAAHGVAAIPTLCYHPDLEVKANCRVCLVELKGGKLVTACSTKVQEGMEVFTDTEKVKRARKTNLEMIFGQHAEKCPDCIWDKNCSLQNYSKKYQGKVARFKDRKASRNLFGFSNTILFDQTKCIDCNNCIETCHQQEVHFYDKTGKGADSIVGPTKNKKYDCTTCGQCITHCPVGAIQGNPHWPEVEASLQDKKKIVVAQVAPSVRASIGEEFGYEPGTVVTGELVAALKKLGFDYVFDTNFGADITTFEEASECFECLGKGKMITTSCCPAWVKFVEFYYPEFVDNLSTTKSPQQCLAVAVKTYFAEKMKIDPRKIKVVSIMPCVAKKFEADRLELEFNGMKMVDYVLTTREVAHMIHRAKIDFTKMKPQDFDHPLGQSSGAAAIYGVSGGVMESALRTALDYYAGEKLKSIDFKQVRGLEGTKKAELLVKGKKVKIIVTSGLGNAKKVLDLIKAGKEKPHFLEVMACPGGCINGGGQPVPTSAQIRAKRAAPLYSLDKKSKFRKAHDNPDLKKLYSQYVNKHPDLHHEMFHTSNYQQKRWGSRKLN